MSTLVNTESHPFDMYSEGSSSENYITAKEIFNLGRGKGDEIMDRIAMEALYSDSEIKVVSEEGENKKRKKIILLDSSSDEEREEPKKKFSKPTDFVGELDLICHDDVIEMDGIKFKFFVWRQSILSKDEKNPLGIMYSFRPMNKNIDDEFFKSLKNYKVTPTLEQIVQDVTKIWNRRKKESDIQEVKTKFNSELCIYMLPKVRSGLI